MSFEMEKLKGKRPDPGKIPTGYAPSKTSRKSPTRKQVKSRAPRAR